MPDPVAVGSDRAALTLEIDSEGVAWIIFDRPGAKVNVLSAAVLRRLEELLDELEPAVREGRARGLVIRSGKPAAFLAGADVGEIESASDPAEVARMTGRVQQLFRRVDRLPVPSVAAIDGTCLGGGTELALACRFRIASDRPETRIGLPEVRLGIIPGFGGTVRLPRLIGLSGALDLILTGKTVSAREAVRSGLLDERVPTPVLYRRAAALAQGAAPAARLRKPLVTRLLDGTGPGRRLVLSQARKRVMRETRGHYPAPLAALDVVRRTHGRALDEALAEEAKTVGHLATSEVSKNLIHVFHLLESPKKVDPGAEPRPVERVGVLGAGVMGGGIAQLMAQKGIAVRMKDIAADALASGLRHAAGLFDRLARRRRLTRIEANQQLALISPTLDYAGFGAVDLVVEAVVERLDVKQAVLREAESHVRPGTVLASNTSSLSITAMQEVLARPGDFCGMHFFNPVDRMPLVEIIRGERTADPAVATVFALTRRLGKTPLIVRDGPGFLVNRLLGPYLNEAAWLLVDGASIEDIDEALLEFGMPMGPLRLLDEVGLDVARHAGATLHEAFGERMSPPPLLERLGGSGRLGKKNGRGFYVHAAGKAEPDEAVYGDAGLDTPRRELPRSEIVDRTILAMINEAARALEDGIVAGPGEVDLGMITGTGFPPFRGGLLRHADRIGTPAIVSRLAELERRHGARFEAAHRVRELAGAGAGFYDDAS
jgi:3-hydroxyacyl-CoA dehydrogenase / enoyl-CoA hydratase / 3-hydroxybutyryl-CoA epimerase